MMDNYNKISPIERLQLTQRIWYQANITREDAARILHNKEPGNFLVRDRGHHHGEDDSQLALSIKMGSRHGLHVQHFIILKINQRFLLEDSDFWFGNIVSLVFHYSNICDELPEKLTLPHILEDAKSVQALESFSLLGKEFWKYPMSKLGQRTVMTTEKLSEYTGDKLFAKNKPTSQNEIVTHKSAYQMKDPMILQKNNYNTSAIDHPNQIKEGSELNHISSCLVTSPHRPPRRVSSKDSSPSAEGRKIPSINFPRSQQRRKSDSSYFAANENASCTSPEISDQNITRITVKSSEENSFINNFYTEPKNILSPPDLLLMGRNRKQSYFHDILRDLGESSVAENCSSIQHCDMSSQGLLIGKDNQGIMFGKDIINNFTSSGESTVSDDEEDYSEPVDKVEEKQEHNCSIVQVENMRNSAKLCGDENSSRQWKSDEDIKASCFSVRKHRKSDCNIRYSRQRSETDSASVEFEDHNKSSIRKMSLGNMFRRLSTRKTSTSEPIAEKRLSSVLAKLVGGGDGNSRRAYGGSYQVDSSSWEFLNKDADDFQCSEDHCLLFENKKDHQPCYQAESKDSVHGSEYDLGSSTMHTSQSMNQAYLEIDNISSNSSQKYSMQCQRVLSPPSDHSMDPVIQKIEKKIMFCVYSLAMNENTFLSKSTSQFISSTIDNHKKEDSVKVMNNMREFMTMMVDFLVKTGEGELHQMIMADRSKLKSSQFINLDKIFDEVLQEILVKPLTPYLEGLISKESGETGN